ncbi:hypothetical protein FRB91_008474, partial [Serendipita sp. 411]
ISEKNLTLPSTMLIRTFPSDKAPHLFVPYSVLHGEKTFGLVAELMVVYPPSFSSILSHKIMKINKYY